MELVQVKEEFVAEVVLNSGSFIDCYTCTQLQQWLKRHGLDVTGTKPKLVDRVSRALKAIAEYHRQQAVAIQPRFCAALEAIFLQR